MNVPSCDVDLWSKKTLAEPFPIYRELRDLGPVVYLPRHDLHAVGRYDDVKAVLRDWRTYSSAHGVGFNEAVNQSIAGSLIGSDPPEHRRFRGVLEQPLRPSALRDVRARVAQMARKIIGELSGRAEIEAVSELASRLPVLLVAELVGLPPEGRDQMLAWASAGFNALAPEDVDGVAESVTILEGMTAYFVDPTLPSRVRPRSWAAHLDAAVAAGEISREEFRALLQMNYTLAALDTTIHATSNMLWLLATDKDAWKALKADPALVVQTVHEVLRLEGPVQAFSRVLTVETEIGGIRIPAGRRLLVSYASANRDERHYPEPDRFNIARNPTDHLAFGHGEHVCLGRNLATMEMVVLLSELVQQVDDLELRDSERTQNNSLRGFSKLNIALSVQSGRQ